MNRIHQQTFVYVLTPKKNIFLDLPLMGKSHDGLVFIYGIFFRVVQMY